MTWTLVACVLAPWILTRVIKLCHDVWKAKSFSWSMLFYDGGFPSSHTAFVFGLVGFFWFETGASYWFFISLVVGLIVGYDAFNVRWVTGEQSKAINKLMAKDKNHKPLNERVGHTIPEVIGGAVIGLLVPWLIFLLF
ncbi:divergent PAP2 family protein [Candidatus Woesearchaeota archaeon]|nr:divergent PAP2 family protein [Candidatus Woesearchaeota archaeon]